MTKGVLAAQDGVGNKADIGGKVILILGGRGDDHADAIQTELQVRGAEVTRLDPDFFSSEGAVTLAVDAEGHLNGIVHAGRREVHMEDIRGVCIGRQGRLAMAKSLADRLDQLDVPIFPAPPSSIDQASAWDLQRKVASDVGFHLLPEPASSTVLAGDDDNPFAAPAEAGADLAAVVVGDNVFAISIDSSVTSWHLLDWWRYNEAQTHFTHYVLSEADSQRCRQLVQRLGLEYGVIALAGETGDGLTFLGLDPYRHFGWIEQATKVPATRLLVDRILTPSSIVHHVSRPLPADANAPDATDAISRRPQSSLKPDLRIVARSSAARSPRQQTLRRYGCA